MSGARIWRWPLPPKEFAEYLAANGVILSARTIRERCALWRRRPNARLGIPYLRNLGEHPYRIPQSAAARLLTETLAA